MPRAPRFNHPGRVYHVIHPGSNNGAIFHDEDGPLEFSDWLKKHFGVTSWKCVNIPS